MPGGDCEVLMYARVPTFKVSTQGIEASIRLVEDVTMPQLRNVPGFKGLTMLVNRETGMVRVVVYWDSRETLEASAETGKRLRAEIVEKIQGAELVSVEEFEVAVNAMT